MEYRINTKLNVKTSLLGFGCMRFPLNSDGTINEEETTKMFDRAINNGINYIDTAYPYLNGASEPFVGKVIKRYDRSKLYIATKLPIWMIESNEQAIKIFNEQFEHLDTNYIDFYLLHALNRNTFKKCIDLGLIDFCEQMQKEGKIRHLGFSFHDSYEIFEEIINYRDWDFCQIQFNYMDTDFQAGLRGLRLCEEKNIPNIIMEPLKGGTLAVLPSEVDNVFKTYDKYSSTASWGLRYVGSFKNVLVLLSGMSSKAQMDDNLKTFKDFKPINAKEEIIINHVVKTLKARVKNGCTGCEYCLPCPKGVNIPRIFKMWNTLSMYDNFNEIKGMFENTKESELPTQCIKCGLCESKCPQHLDIRENLVTAYNDILNFSK